MHHVNGTYTTPFNVKRARSGHLCQGCYKAIVVEKEEYVEELPRYVHLNPVRVELKTDHRLRQKVEEIEKMIKMCNVET